MLVIFRANLLHKISVFGTVAVLLAASTLFPSTSANAATDDGSEGEQSSQQSSGSRYAPTRARQPGNGLSTSSDFFPIAVWLQTPESSAKKYKDIGVNTFIGLPKATTSAALSALSGNGMGLLAVQNATGIRASNTTMKAWTQMDEPDGAKIDKNGKQIGCNATPSSIVKSYNSMKSADSLRRPVYLNFTAGVASLGHDSCKTPAMYKQYMKGADIVSFDVYSVNSGLPLTTVAKGVDNLRSWTGDKKPVYVWLETTAYNGGTAPTPKQTKAQVWMAITHGASGIGYFCHIFKPKQIEAGLLSLPTMSRAVAAINAQITSLAPVLNSATVASGASVKTSGKIDLMTKSYDGATYVFAVGMSGANTTATIRPAHHANGTVSVVGENRKLNLTNGAFTDKFAGYDVHIYKIASRED